MTITIRRRVQRLAPTLALSGALLLGGSAAQAQSANSAYQFSPAQPRPIDPITLSLTLSLPPAPNQCLGLKLVSVSIPERTVDVTMDYSCPSNPPSGPTRTVSIGRLPAGDYVVFVHSGLDIGTPPPPARLELSVADPAIPATSNVSLALLGVVVLLLGAGAIPLRPSQGFR